MSDIPSSGRRARIYRPTKPPTQSGRGARDWLLEFEPLHRQEAEPLMGWIRGGDVERQLELRFPTREAAEMRARELGLDFTVTEEERPALKLKSYADNFRWKRST